MRKFNRQTVAGLLRRLFFKTTSISILFAATSLLALPLAVEAQTPPTPDTYTVCPAGPSTCDYATPEDAVNDPARIDGDTIDIATATYVLSATLQVDNSITILGNDSVFDANGIRAINVFGAATNFSMSNITIANGQPTPGFGGGAMWISGGATATVVNGTFVNNQAEFGGAVHNIGSTVTLRESVFTGNRATVGDGGAVLTDSGITSVVRTEIDGNQANVAGGGLAVTGTGSLEFIQSTVSNNARTGIGVSGVSNDVADPQVHSSWSCPVGVSGTSAQSFVASSVAGSNSLSAYDFEIRFGGTPPGAGTVYVGRVMDIQNGLPGIEIGTSKAVIPVGATGSIWLRYTMDIPVVLKPGNLYLLEAGVPPGAVFGIMGLDNNPYAAGQASNCGSVLSPNLDFDFRTFSALDGSGGIYLASSLAFTEMIVSTVSGNVGDGITVSSGGNVEVSYSTITNNSGNGLTVQTGGSGDLLASIIAGNGIYDCDGSTNSIGYNLVGDDTNCVITPTTGDQIGTFQAPIDPLLGPLQYNGGRTATHAIDPTSPAFDSAELTCSVSTIDQRGQTRPNGEACDIGSFEYTPLVGTLQTQINEAAQGATINVSDGIYAEAITIGDGKTLAGSGPDNVIIDATNLNSSAITASGSFTLTGIRVTGGNSDDHGGGIFADIDGTDISLNNVVFDNNSADLDGGAVYLRNGTLTASNATFTSNSADDGNGGAIFSGTVANISGSLFNLNQAAENGGAIAATGTLSSSNNTFQSNNADNGGAISVDSGDTPSANSSDDLFTANTATLNGGAIYESGLSLDILRSVFQSNTAGDSNLEIAGDGGAIYSDNRTVINQGLFSSNSAADGDGVPGDGGSIFYNGTLNIVDTTVENSSASRGGGLYGTINGVATISGTTLANNSADGSGTTGGAIGGAGTLEIRNSTLSGNTASGNSSNGGGIGLFGGSARLNNVTLAFNSATGLGGPLYAAFSDFSAFISFSNTLFFGNTGGGTDCLTIESLGYNLFENTPCPILASDLVGDPLIDFLASNGGPTQTHALDPQSPSINAGYPVSNFSQFDAGNFGTLQTQGFTDLDAGTLFLAGGVFNVGSAFVANPIDPGQSFSARFQFEIVPGATGAADGFTFTISDDPTVLGQSGGFLGIGASDPIEPFPAVIGIVDGVSVEFDTWLNGQAEGANDPVVDHIGIDINGSLSSVAFTPLSSGALSDGNVWTAWIDYNAFDDTLEVRASNNGIRPALPTVEATVDIESLTGPVAYVGFTGATGSAGISGEQRILSFSFDKFCESSDQRGEPRPEGAGCDIGAYEAAPVPLALGQISLLAVTDLEPVEPDFRVESYPGVTDIPIIDIPIEKLTGDTFNAPESAPLGSFPIGSFPIGSFDLRDSPLGSFPLGSFPIGSFPIGSFPLGSFPLSSIPLLTEGGWSEIIDGIPELAGAPLQLVTLEQLLTVSPGAVDGITLRDLSIEGSSLGSLSLPSLSLGETTVDVLDQWASSADPSGAEPICTTLSTEETPFTDCGDGDTLLSLEVKGAPVDALSLSSLPLGSFPIGSFPIGSFPIGSFPLGSFPIGSFPIGSFPIGSFPLGSFPIGSFPIGSFNLLAAPIGSFPLGSFPIGSFPLGSFEIDGKSFCEFYNEQALADGSASCEVLGVDPQTDSLADLVTILESANPTGDTLSSTPLGSFPMGSFPIGSFPIGSFDLATLSTPPISLLILDDIDGCTVIDNNSSDTCGSLALSNDSTLADAAAAYGGSLAASPLGSFPIGSFDVAGLPMGSFPIGSFYINGAPLGSFPIGSFDLISSPMGSFPIGSFSNGPCADCTTLADAARAGVLDGEATLADLKAEAPAEFATLELGDVLDAMTLSTLYCPPDPDPLTEPTVDCAETLGDIEDTGNLTLGQLLIAMLLKTDFPWETISLDQMDSQEFSADNFVDFYADFALTGNETGPVSVAVTLDDGFLYVEGSANLDITSEQQGNSSTPISDPVIVENDDGTQTLGFNLVLGGFSNSTVRFTTVPPLALGDYDASLTVALGEDEPLPADINDGNLAIISDPRKDISDLLDPLLTIATPEDVLSLGFISEPDDNDFYTVMPPPEGARVSVFMSNPAGDNDLLMYAPVTAVEEQGQQAESAPLDSVPFEDDGVDYEGNISEEPNALEDVNLANAPPASISTNRGDLDESVSAIADDNEPFIIQVSGYNGAISEQPYTLRVKVTQGPPSPQCSARDWTGGPTATVLPAGAWLPDTNAVFLVNGARLAASEGVFASSDANATAAADAALTAINNLVSAPGITNGIVVDVSDITGVDYTAWDANPCDVDAANSIVNAITAYIEEQRVISPNLTYVTIVGSDEVIPFARKPDETSIANESTYAGEFSDNAMYGALVTRHFLSDDSYGDIDPIPWLDRYLNVPELGVGRLVEAAADIQLAAENYLAFGGILDPQTALSAGYDFVADAAKDIDDTFDTYSPVFGYVVEDELIDEPGVDPLSAWDRTDFLAATGLNTNNPTDQVSFNMHFDFDEALPSSGDASGDYSSNLITTADLAGTDLDLGIWFTVGCHSGTNVPDISVVGGAPSEDWAQSFSRLGALYLAQNAFGLGDTEALALTERLMANFARNLNGSMTIGQAHAFAKQQYFADLGLYGEYDYKAMQAATLFGLPMYQYGNGAMVTDPLPPALPVAADPISGLISAPLSLETNITRTPTGKGDLFTAEDDDLSYIRGGVQFVHFRPLQPIVSRDVTSPGGERASGAFLTSLVTEDFDVPDIAFARPVIDLGENEPEIETDEVVFPTAFTNIANYKAPPVGGGPFEPRDQLNIIVGQFTSALDGGTDGTERLFRNLDAQIFYRPAASAASGSPAPFAAAATAGDFVRPEFDNVQATIFGSPGSEQATFSVDVTDEGMVKRVAVLYLKSVADGKGNWVLVDLVKGSGKTWTGGGPVEDSALVDGEVDYMVQAVDDNGNVANSTFKGEFYVAKDIPTAPPPGGIGVVITVDGDEVPTGDWITTAPVDVIITDQAPLVSYEYSVDFQPYQPLTSDGFQITGDGVHIVTVRQTDGSNPVTFVVLIDTTPPQVVITTPAEGEFVTQGMAPAADYDCLDAGSGITSCVGTVPDGDPVPSTPSSSAQSFVVTAQDDAGLGPTMSENMYYVVKSLDVSGPIDPTAVGSEFTITASATDLEGFFETASINWGDGTETPVDLSGPSVDGVHDIEGSHSYSSPSVYQITVTVVYENESSGIVEFTQIDGLDFVVIYDSSGGFVTGGGWVNSPPGAYTPNNSGDPYVTGKAHFGFVSKYKKGQSVPTGSTNFRFAAGNLEFEATSYDWMIISGARARYKGEGTVNDDSELYKFMVTALDADISGSGITQDGFRIKIWQEDSSGSELVLYDNGLGADSTDGTGGTTPLGGGSIKIHNAKKK